MKTYECIAHSGNTGKQIVIHVPTNYIIGVVSDVIQGVGNL